METKRTENQMAKEDMLIKMTRLVPGTVDIAHCQKIEYCMSRHIRNCDDIKNLCISSRDNERIIGGISFLFGVKDGKDGIMIHRYGQAGCYVNLYEGDGFNDVMNKLEKDENIKEITERTKFINDEAKDAENQNTINAFKRYLDLPSDKDVCILVTKKDDRGNYDKLDMELIRLAKEKEKTGKKIKIIDRSEIYNKFYILGISSKEQVNKLELEANTLMEADDRINIFVFPATKNTWSDKSKIKQDCAGIIAINSIDDDVVGKDDRKESLKKYLTDRYSGLYFISSEILKIGDKNKLKK